MNEIFELDLEDGGLSTIKELDKLEQLILVNGMVEGKDKEIVTNLWGSPNFDFRKYPNLKKLQLVDWVDRDEGMGNIFEDLNTIFPNIEGLYIENFKQPISLIGLSTFKNAKLIKLINTNIEAFVDVNDNYFFPIDIPSHRSQFEKLETIDQFSVIDQNSLKNLKNIKVIEHLEILKVDDFEELFKFLNRTKINKLFLGIVNANSKNVLLNNNQLSKLLSLNIKTINIYGEISFEDRVYKGEMNLNKDEALND